MDRPGGARTQGVEGLVLDLWMTPYKAGVEALELLQSISICWRIEWLNGGGAALLHRTASLLLNWMRSVSDGNRFQISKFFLYIFTSERVNKTMIRYRVCSSYSARLLFPRRYCEMRIGSMQFFSLVFGQMDAAIRPYTIRNTVIISCIFHNGTDCVIP